MDDTGAGDGAPSYWEEPKPGGCLKVVVILMVAFGLIVVILVALILVPAILMNMDPAFHEPVPLATSPA